MPALQKFDVLTKNIADGVHDFDNHVFKVVLTNTAPVVGNTVLANITQIANGNGYTTGGATTTATTSTSSGTARVICSDVVWTASGGAIGPFRYAVIYNDTPTSPADPLIGWLDYGSSVSLIDTETLTVDFDPTNGILALT